MYLLYKSENSYYAREIVCILLLQKQNPIRNQFYVIENVKTKSKQNIYLLLIAIQNRRY